jgi:hypothetical protein
MSASKKHRTVHELLQYLKGTSSSRERHAFERDLERDPFMQEALEGYERISPEEAEDDLLSLHHRLLRRKNRRRRITWYSMAAAVASVLIIGTIFLQIYDLTPAETEQGEMLEEVTPGEVPPAREKPALEQEEMLEEVAPGEAVAEQPAGIEVERTDRTTQQDVKVQELTSRGAREKSAPPQAEPEAYLEDAEEIVAVEAAPVSKRKDGELAPSVYREISGTVISAEDGAPVGGASVTASGTDPVSISDMEGRFSIPVAHDSQTTVRASLTGMEPEQVTIPGGEEVTIILRPESEQLKDQALFAVKEAARDEGRGKGVIQLRSPEPSEGYVSFYRYIEENRRSIEIDTAATEGLVLLKFKVESTGEIKDIEALKTPGEPYTEEAIRLLKEGPPWIPAFDENGSTIDQEVTLRIVL